MPLWAASPPASSANTMQGGGTPAAARGASAFKKLWRREHPLLGIDIGGAAVKLVELRRLGGTVHLNNIATRSTPSLAVRGGTFTDSIAVSGVLREIFERHRIRRRRAALAVGGEKSRAQREALPAEACESEEALRAYVERAARSQVSFDLDLAALDYETLASPNGKTGSIFWASSGAAEVDWTRQAAALAGCVPAIIEPRACSLFNAYLFNHGTETASASLLLHAGARWMTVALVRDRQLLYSRDLPLPQSSMGGNPPAADEIPRVLRQRLKEFATRAAPATIERLVLSGNLSVEGYGEEFRRQTGLRVQQMDPFRRISHNASSTEGEMIRDWGPLFSIAVGLALRGFEDL